VRYSRTPDFFYYKQMLSENLVYLSPFEVSNVNSLFSTSSVFNLTILTFTSLDVEANVALPNRVAKNYTEKMRRKLASPESYQMQLLMGGRPTDGDFYKPVASELGALSMAD